MAFSRTPAYAFLRRSAPPSVPQRAQTDFSLVPRSTASTAAQTPRLQPPHQPPALPSSGSSRTPRPQSSQSPRSRSDATPIPKIQQPARLTAKYIKPDTKPETNDPQPNTTHALELTTNPTTEAAKTSTPSPRLVKPAAERPAIPVLGDELEAIAALLEPLDYLTLGRCCAVNKGWHATFGPILSTLSVRLSRQIEDLARVPALASWIVSEQRWLDVIADVRTAHVKELKALARPPRGLTEVVNAVLLLTSHPAVGPPQSFKLDCWKNAQKGLNHLGVQGFISHLASFSASSLLADRSDRLARVQAVREQDFFNVQHLQRASLLGATLGRFVIEIVDALAALQVASIYPWSVDGVDDAVALVLERERLRAIEAEIKRKREVVAATPHVCLCGARFAKVSQLTTHRLSCGMVLGDGKRRTGDEPRSILLNRE